MATRRARTVLAAVTCAGIVVLYYLLPVEPGVRGAELVLRLVGTALIGALVTWMIFRQTSRQLADPMHGRLDGLLVAIIGGVAFFALVDYSIAINRPGEFVGLATKTDALYYALTTLTTVGYGDIYAAGQFARAVVSVQLVFNVAVIATAASILARAIAARRRHGDPPLD